jgi:hypothetical protein
MRSYFALKGRDPALVDTLLAEGEIDPRLRGEALPVDEYRRLGALLLERNTEPLGPLLSPQPAPVSQPVTSA